MIDKYTIRKMNHLDLEIILEWRNHPDIRKNMFSQEIINLQEHQNWFQKASVNPNKILLIFELNGQPEGYINFSLMINNEAHWGFYTSPKSRKGLGSIMGGISLDYAFKELKVLKIHGQAISSNLTSIKYHKKMGFHQKNILSNSFYNDDKYEDIICFELTRDHWSLR